MTPSIESVFPAAVGAAGGELVRLTAADITPRVEVRFGDVEAEVLAVRAEGTRRLVDVRAPAGNAGDLVISLQNLDTAGARIPGEKTAIAFRLLRAAVSAESDLTRLVRTLLRALKAQVIANAGTPVSLDYREQISPFIPVAKVPSITVLGPDIRENRLYSTNESGERVVSGPAGLEIEHLRPPMTVDLRFVLEVVTNTTAEHLNLFAALVQFVHRNPYLVIERDPREPAAGAVRFPLFAEGEARTPDRADDSRGRKDDRHVFEWALVIRGFPIDDHIATGRSQQASEGIQVRVRPAVPGTSSPEGAA
jgi:hypothetical protein